MASIYEMREKHRKEPKRDGLATLLDLIGRGVDVYSTIKGIGLAERQQNFAEEQAAAQRLAAQRTAAERGEDEYAKAALGLRGAGYTRPDGPREIDADWGKSLMDLLGELDRGELVGPEPELEPEPFKLSPEELSEGEKRGFIGLPTGEGRYTWKAKPEPFGTGGSTRGVWNPSLEDFEQAEKSGLRYFKTGDGRWQLRKVLSPDAPLDYAGMIAKGMPSVRTTYGTYGVPGKAGVSRERQAADLAMRAYMEQALPPMYVDEAYAKATPEEYMDWYRGMLEQSWVTDAIAQALHQFAIRRFGGLDEEEEAEE